MKPVIRHLRQPITLFLGLILVMVVVLPGTTGAANELTGDQPIPEQIGLVVLAGSPSPTASNIPNATSLPSATTPPQATPTLYITPVVRLATSGRPEVYAFIEALPGALDRPYVVLTAYRSVASERPVEIRGTINSVEFVCPSSPCILPVERTSRIQFQAQSQYGETSDLIQATARSEEREDGYYVSIETMSQFFTFSDACAGMWKIKEADTKFSWAVFPQNPDQLNTKKTLHFLAGNLITSGLVTASDCPGGGVNYGAPNACGLERSRTAMINWQNQYDFNIWLTAKDLRVPPRILKTLIEIESQFWPGNSRSYLDEFGLGQISQLGIDVLLRQNPALYNQICPAVLSDCSAPYSVLSPTYQAMIRGALMNSLNADCPTCPTGFDHNTAKQSLTLIALLLRANCQQTQQILDEVDETASYEDYWKFTLVSYHGGYACLNQAVREVVKEGSIVNWRNVSRKLNCTAGGYVTRVWDSLATFDQYRLLPGELKQVTVNPTFIPTPTPLPTIGPPPSRAKIWVIVILDMNNNGIGEPDEWVSGIPVQIILPDGRPVNGITEDGKAIFDMTGSTTGTEIQVTVPTLYRSETIRLPASGVVPIVFVFQSVAPTLLP